MTGKRVLVVDDESHIRSIIRKYGEFEGYQVYEAENGEQAIEACYNHRHDINEIIYQIKSGTLFLQTEKIDKEDVPEEASTN